MKKAIVYYSMLGNCEYVAKVISKKVDADLIRIEPKKEYPNKGFKKFFWGGKSALMKEKPELENYEFDSEKYDLIVFGSPVWAAQFTPPIRTFINENKSKLENKKFVAFMCYSGSGAENAISKLKEILEVKELEAELLIIDPKDRKTDEKDKKIEEFCEKISNIK